jgi:hypothetical protein
MSADSNLQEMENVVTQNAAPAEPMQASGVPYEDLGGPTPENSRPDDDSNKLETPGKTLAQVKNVVNARAARAEEVEADEEQEVVAEEEEVTEEEISEEEISAEEVVTEEEAPEFNIEEDVQALFEGEELSEEFQEKARTIFEAAITSKVNEIKENLQSAYETVLVEEIETIKEGLTERLDAYLEYVADEWIQENALAVEHGLKTEMTESFLAGMKGLFEEHYVTIPEDRYDVIESMVDKLDEMESKLNEQIERNVALNRRLAESVADVIFAEVAEGLALSQKDKLATLAENVEFESESDYREKLVTLKKSYFPEHAGAQRDHSETISEGTSVVGQVSASPLMESYMDTLRRVAKK